MGITTELIDIVGFLVPPIGQLWWVGVKPNNLKKKKWWSVSLSLVELELGLSFAKNKK